MTQSERQLAIRDYISEKRVTNCKELMNMFGVSKPTILNDLSAITSIACFELVRGRAGGIYAAEGWFSSRRYLTDEQQELLERLTVGLSPKDAAVMAGILSSFGMKNRAAVSE